MSDEHQNHHDSEFQTLNRSGFADAGQQTLLGDSEDYRYVQQQQYSSTSPCLSSYTSSSSIAGSMSSNLPFPTSCTSCFVNYSYMWFAVPRTDIALEFNESNQKPLTENTQIKPFPPEKLKVVCSSCYLEAGYNVGGADSRPATTNQIDALKSNCLNCSKSIIPVEGQYYCSECIANSNATSSSSLDLSLQYDDHSSTSQSNIINPAAAPYSSLFSASSSPSSSLHQKVINRVLGVIPLENPFNQDLPISTAFPAFHALVGGGAKNDTDDDFGTSLKLEGVKVTQKICTYCSTNKSLKWINIAGTDGKVSCIHCFHISKMSPPVKGSTISASSKVKKRSSASPSSQSSSKKQKHTKDQIDYGVRECNLCGVDNCPRWVRDNDPSRPKGYLCTSCYASSRSGSFIEEDGTQRTCNTCNIVAAKRWVHDKERGGYNCNPCHQRYRNGLLGRKCLSCSATTTSSWVKDKRPNAIPDTFFCKACSSKFNP